MYISKSCFLLQNRLLEIINKKLSDNPSGFPGQVAEAKFSSSEVASGNLLLFTSALVPKALASILTSFVIALSEDVSCFLVDNLIDGITNILIIMPRPGKHL